MKILHVIPVYAPAWQFGGPVRSVSALCEGLVAKGHDVTVATTTAGLDPLRNNDSFVRKVVNGVTVFYFKHETGIRGIESSALDHQMTELVSGANIVHITAIWQPVGISACNKSRACKVPYVISPRGALGRYALRRGILKKLAYYALWERANIIHASGFHVTSQFEAFESQLFTKSRPVLISPNSIRLSDWFFDEQGAIEFRKSIDCETTTPILMYSGRLHHKKGLEILPKALFNVKDLPWRLVLVGPTEDDTRHTLEREFADFGISSRVNFIETLSPRDLAKAYSASNVFLMPSHHENFGNVIVEAVACGSKVITTPNVGAAEFLPKESVVVIERNPVVWTSTIRQELILTISNPLNRLDSIPSIEQSFSAIQVATDMAKFYSNIVSCTE